MHIDQCPRKQLSVSNTWAFRSEGSLVGVFSAIMSIVRKVRRRAMTLIRRVLLTWIIISIGAVLVLRRTFSDYQVDESLNGKNPKDIQRNNVSCQSFDVSWISELPNEIAELSFQGFDNETGVDHFIVPNIIHFIRFNQSEVSFVDYICILAAFRNHRPDFIYIHSDSPIEQFHGKYWNWIRNNVDLYSIIRVFHVDLPSHVFGQKISDKWRVWHGSDVTRLGILMKYGGIYLDNDVYVIKSLDKYRKFEAVVNWDDGDDVGNNLIIAHRNARVLPLWLDTYRDYRSNLW